MAVGSFSSSSMPDPAFVPRRFTVEEYRHLGELGVLTEDDNVELLEGVITPKMMHNPPHDLALSLFEESLRALLPKGCYLRIQCSLTTSDSEPEPDLVIVKGHARDYALRHPQGSDALLVAEIADSSLVRDRNKVRIYARASVPAYWIVNLGDEQVEVYWQPSGSSDKPAYVHSAVYCRGDRVSLEIPGSAKIDTLVDDMLP
jgi:Uma2 family endonuclease